MAFVSDHKFNVGNLSVNSIDKELVGMRESHAYSNSNYTWKNTTSIKVKYRNK